MRTAYLREGVRQREDAEADERAEDVEAGLHLGGLLRPRGGLRRVFDHLVSGAYVRVEVEAAELVGDLLLVLGRVELEALVVHLHRLRRNYFSRGIVEKLVRLEAEVFAVLVEELQVVVRFLLQELDHESGHRCLLLHGRLVLDLLRELAAADQLVEQNLHHRGLRFLPLRHRLARCGRLFFRAVEGLLAAGRFRVFLGLFGQVSEALVQPDGLVLDDALPLFEPVLGEARGETVEVEVVPAAAVDEAVVDFGYDVDPCGDVFLQQELFGALGVLGLQLAGDGQREQHEVQRLEPQAAQQRRGAEGLRGVVAEQVDELFGQVLEVLEVCRRGGHFVGVRRAVLLVEGLDGLEVEAPLRQEVHESQQLAEVHRVQVERLRQAGHALDARGEKPLLEVGVEMGILLELEVGFLFGQRELLVPFEVHGAHFFVPEVEDVVLRVVLFPYVFPGSDWVGFFDHVLEMEVEPANLEQPEEHFAGD